MPISQNSRIDASDISSLYTTFNNFIQSYGGSIAKLPAAPGKNTIIYASAINALNNKINEFKNDTYLKTKSSWWVSSSVTIGHVIKASDINNINTTKNNFPSVKCRNQATNTKGNNSQACNNGNSQSCNNGNSQSCNNGNSQSCSHGNSQSCTTNGTFTESCVTNGTHAQACSGNGTHWNGSNTESCSNSRWNSCNNTRTNSCNNAKSNTCSNTKSNTCSNTKSNTCSNAKSNTCSNKKTNACSNTTTIDITCVQSTKTNN